MPPEITIYLKFLLDIIVVIIVSYLYQKGKNYATKEDIGKITNTIEEVKLNFKDKAYIIRKKKETYENIVDGLGFFVDKNNKTEEMKEKLINNYSKGWLWADDIVLNKINEHLTLQIKETEESGSIKQEKLKESYAECIIEMRKNSGYKDTKLTHDDFIFLK